MCHGLWFSTGAQECIKECVLSTQSHQCCEGEVTKIYHSSLILPIPYNGTNQRSLIMLQQIKPVGKSVTTRTGLKAGMDFPAPCLYIGVENGMF